MKKITMLFFMGLLSLYANASGVKVDGIYYELDSSDGTATVISPDAGDDAYSGNIVIPATINFKGAEFKVTSIGSAFYYCTGVTSITVPSTITSIASNAFLGTSWYDNQADGLVYIGPYVYKYKGEMPEATSLQLSDGCLGITEYAFEGYVNLQSVEIPEGVTFIGSFAFKGCETLQSVNIPSSVNFIGDFAFDICRGLTSLTIPGSVSVIPNYCFRDCSGLTAVTINDGVKTIAGSAFYRCTNLSSIVLPTTLEGIGYSAFTLCTSLKSIIIPDGVTNIDDFAFESCSSLVSVNVPNSVRTIGRDAFRSCSSLESVSIGTGVVSIGNGAFNQCNALKSVHITDLEAWMNISFLGASGGMLGSEPSPSNPLEYAHHLYLNGEELKNLIVPNSITEIKPQTFKGCKGLTSVELTGSVTRINNYAFWGCTGLTDLTIPSNVNYIYSQAFYECSGLKTIKIMDGVKGIDSFSFGYCSNLTDVYVYSEEVISANEYAFNNSFVEYATLHVPALLANDYKMKTPWMNFGTIVTLSGEEVETKKCATPTISYVNGELDFSCETEGVEYISVVTVDDAKMNYSDKVILTGIYKVSVYATKEGYENSDVVTEDIPIITGSASSKVGDLNNDGKTDAADVVMLVNMIMNK